MVNFLNFFLFRFFSHAMSTVIDSHIFKDIFGSPAARGKLKLKGSISIRSLIDS